MLLWGAGQHTITLTQDDVYILWTVFQSRKGASWITEMCWFFFFAFSFNVALEFILQQKQQISTKLLTRAVSLFSGFQRIVQVQMTPLLSVSLSALWWVCTVTQSATTAAAALGNLNSPLYRHKGRFAWQQADRDTLLQLLRKVERDKTQHRQ